MQKWRSVRFNGVTKLGLFYYKYFYYSWRFCLGDTDHHRLYCRLSNNLGSDPRIHCSSLNYPRAAFCCIAVKKMHHSRKNNKKRGAIARRIVIYGSVLRKLGKHLLLVVGFDSPLSLSTIKLSAIKAWLPRCDSGFLFCLRRGKKWKF